MCQAAKGSNCPLLENSIRCPLTHFDDDCPLAEDVEKTTQCCFCYDESCSLLLWLSIAHWRICWCSLLMTNAHWLMKMPTDYFADVVETFSLTTTCQFHWHSPPPLSAERRDNLLQNIFELPPFRCRRVSLSYSLIQLHESTIIDSLLAALCVNVVGCRTETTVWLWMTIPKDQSMHNVSSICLIYVGCDILLRNDCTFHNGNKDGDQNTDLPYDRFFDNENISVCLQLEFACIYVCLHFQFMCIDVYLQLTKNLLRWYVQVFWHWRTEWALNNQGYVSCRHFWHILSRVNFDYFGFLPMAWWWVWKKVALEQLQHLKLVGWMSLNEPLYLDWSKT